MGIVASLTLRRDNNARYVVACRALVCDEARFAQEGSDPRDLPHWSVAPGTGSPPLSFRSVRHKLTVGTGALFRVNSPRLYEFPVRDRNFTRPDRREFEVFFRDFSLLTA